LLNERNGAINGIIVNYKNLGFNIFKRFKNGIKALFKKVLNVVINYDNGEPQAIITIGLLK
jgi:hypothetical protein